MGERGRKRLCGEFLIEHNYAKTEAVYDRVFAQ